MEGNAADPVELTAEEARMYEHLKTLVPIEGSRIIRPYWHYGPRAQALYPRQNDKKARGNFRGYVKHLIDLGILVRISEGRYFIHDVKAVVRRDTRARGRRSKGGTFKVTRSAAVPAHQRVQLIADEINHLAGEIQVKQAQMVRLTELLEAVSREL